MEQTQIKLEKIDDYRWLIPREGAMRTEGLIYTDEKSLNKILADKAPGQVANVATLPGIVGRSLAMPDIHWGYGFPIGGVAAMDLEEGVISPGGIGYDISCGMRLLRTNLRKEEVEKKVDALLGAMFQNIPSGVGSTGKLHLNSAEVRRVLTEGAQWAINKGLGDKDDLEYIEDRGRLAEADSSVVSKRALERGEEQLGTLGSGNHFLEIQLVETVFLPQVAEVFGIFPGQIVVMIHTGSRGLGYQVCDDYLKTMGAVSARYGIKLPDRQLACAPIQSPEGKDYFGAMSAAVNYARANRQIITHWIRESFRSLLGISPTDLGMTLVYDVSHNIGKIEEHILDGKKRKLCVHRKGATRAYTAGHPDLPTRYQQVGQPVLIPGTMGTASYVLVGTEQADKETFASTCHGAGRAMSRSQATRMTEGREVERQLAEKGIKIQTASYRGLAEEAPFAYKDVDQVVEICHRAGISRKVAKLSPLGVIKG